MDEILEQVRKQIEEMSDGFYSCRFSSQTLLEVWEPGKDHWFCKIGLLYWISDATVNRYSITFRDYKKQVEVISCPKGEVDPLLIKLLEELWMRS